MHKPPTTTQQCSLTTRRGEEEKKEGKLRGGSGKKGPEVDENSERERRWGRGSNTKLRRGKNSLTLHQGQNILQRQRTLKPINPFANLFTLYTNIYKHICQCNVGPTLPVWTNMAAQNGLFKPWVQHTLSCYRSMFRRDHT